MLSISSEPARLQAEQHRVRKELAATAVQHYPVLVDAAARATAIAQSSGAGVAIAGACASSLEHLQRDAATLQSAGVDWRQQKATISVVSGTVSKISELLEAPATLESCIRSDLYHEARLIIEHVAGLVAAMPDVKLVRHVAVQLNDTLQALLSTTVLPRLAGNMPITLALKITSFLRHIGVAENELRDSFLALRTEFVQSFVAEEEVAHATMPASLLKRVIVHWKSVVPEAIVTFNGCFAASPENAEAIATWAIDRTYQLLFIWKTHLNAVTNGMDLAELATEVGHCCSSWASVGVDLTTLFLESIADRVSDLFASHVEAGLEAGLVALSNHSWKHAPPSSSKSDETVDANAAPTPPSRLVQCLPLTYVAHGIVTACNDIRRCAAVPAWTRCTSVVERCVDRIVSEILLIREEAALGAEADRDGIEWLVAVTLDDWVPFVCRCVDYVFDRDELVNKVMLKVKTQLRNPNR